MKARRLVRLYPPQWRARYGAEFLEMIGAGALRPRQVVNIVMGAIDAWLSADVRRSAARAPLAAPDGGRLMFNSLTAACLDTRPVSTRNALISAAVLIATSAVLLSSGIAAGRLGYAVWGDALKSLALPLSVVVSMPFSVMKGQCWRAQAVVLGTTTTILLLATWLSTVI